MSGRVFGQPHGGATAVVTGASSGIGLAIATAMVGAGYRVAGLARREAVMRDNLPPSALAVECDVTKPFSVTSAVQRVNDEFGRIDALVNCAGIVRRLVVMDIDEEDIDAHFQANLFGAIRMCAACLPMLRATKGSIINFSSTLTQRPVAGVSLYAATKGGVEAFTRALALEEGQNGIRANAILPALVRSEIWASAGMSSEAYEVLVRTRAAEYPLGRVGEPEDVAALALFLCSPDSSWLSGACIPLDGASSINASPGSD